MVTSQDRSTGLARQAGRAGRRWRTAVAAVAAGAVLLSAGCSSGDKSPSWQGGSQGDGGSAASASPAPPESTVSVTSPKADATGVEALAEIKYATEDPDKTTVSVKNASGDEVDGKPDK